MFKKNILKSYISVILNINREEKKQSFLLAILILFLIVLELFSLALFLPLITIIVSDSIGFFEGYNFFFNDWTKINKIILFLMFIVIIFIIKNLLNAYVSYQKLMTLAKVQVNFSSRMFYSILTMPYEYHLNKNTSETLRNVNIQMEYIAVVENLINFIIDLLILIGIVSLIFSQNLQVGLLIIFFVSMAFIITNKYFSEKFMNLGKLFNIHNKKYLQINLDTFSSIKEIILLAKQRFFYDIYKNNLNDQIHTQVKSNFFMELPRLIIEVGVVIVSSIIVYLIFSKTNNSSDGLIQLSFMIALIFKSLPSINKCIFAMNNLSNKLPIIHITNSLIQKFPEKIINKKINKINFREFKAENVNFFYDNKNYIFKNLNFNFKEKDVIGIVGTSGSGKSTLIDIVSGFFKPNSGNLMINGQELSEQNVDSWRNCVSYISQKNFIIGTNLKENIAFGEKENEIDYEKLEKVIRQAKIENLVKNKGGVDFEIKDDGKNLSGGQRQRIILARALYRNSEILILDEATSSLDEDIENEIFDEIKQNFYKKKTIIISTHKKSLLSFCDKIYDIDELKKI